MKRLLTVTRLTSLAILVALAASCSDDDAVTTDPNTPGFDVPDNYTFTRDGASTVSFSGQTTRILMGGELNDALEDPANSEEKLLEMFANQAADGSDVDPWSNPDLNAATKSLRSKVAASYDYFRNDATTSAAIRSDFEQFIRDQVNVVFPNWDSAAAPGVAGQIADGSTARYVDGNGLEMPQLWNKGMIGALMADQMLNNYLGTGVLDEADNRANNDAGITAEGKPYTNMEHKWDEAYGYLFGTATDKANPLPTVGDDDDFLNKYLGRVENDPDFAGIAATIFNAFKTGRAAIEAKDYEERDRQAEILRKEVSKVIAVRAVFYLKDTRDLMAAGNTGGAFHSFSEGYGFIYSLQFTRNPDTDAPYFSRSEVDNLLNDLLDDGSNGLWDVQAATLEQAAQTIASRFGFSPDQV